MKIKFSGELHIHRLRQAIFEKLHEIEDELLVHYSRDVTLYLTPTNGFGHRINIKDNHGREVQVLHSDGPYKSAADDYDVS